MIEQKLKQIGLSDKEILVFLCVLQYQKITPAKVSMITKINRPTVYSVSKELGEKGLIDFDEAGSSKYLVSLGEAALKNITKLQEAKIVQIKKDLPSIVEELKQLPKQGKYSIPKIRFVDESRLREFLINESSKWAESAEAHDKTWWGYQDHTLLEHYEDWADHFWTKFPEDISLNLLTNKKLVETKVMKKKNYKSKRNIRYWKGVNEFTSTHVVVGDYVLMIVTREHPHYLVEIYDKMMAENLRNLFKGIWEQLS